MIGDDEPVAGVADGAKRGGEGPAERLGGNDPIRRSVSEHAPAGAQDKRPIAQTQRQVEIMQDDRDADGALTSERTDEVDGAKDMAGIHRGEGLIGEQEPLESRIFDLEEGAGEGRPLTLSGAQLREGLVGPIVQFDPLQRPEDFLPVRAGGGESPHRDDLGDAVTEGDLRMLGDEGEMASPSGRGHPVDP